MSPSTSSTSSSTSTSTSTSLTPFIQPINYKEGTVDSDIQDCKDLLEHTLKQNFDSNDINIIYPEATKIFSNSKVALYAQSFTGHAMTIHMKRLKLPEELQFFVNLAEKGPGHTESYDGVRYKFIKVPKPPGSVTSSFPLGLDVPMFDGCMNVLGKLGFNVDTNENFKAAYLKC